MKNYSEFQRITTRKQDCTYLIDIWIKRRGLITKKWNETTVIAGTRLCISIIWIIDIFIYIGISMCYFWNEICKLAVIITTDLSENYILILV